MARTFRAEGRQLANLLRALFVAIALLVYFAIPGLHWGFFFAFIFIGVIIAELTGAWWIRYRREQKQGKRKSISHSKTTSKKTVEKNAHDREASRILRGDEEILNSMLTDLSGAEFERLLALYFRDQGYIVHEVGVGGNDGGVDLVIIDRRGEKTAVQAKCYAEHNKVPVQTVRELVAAKRNHDCILSLLVTTSDLTAPAKKEAEQFKVDYWHGALVEQKLKSWGKWKPAKRKKRGSAPSGSSSAVKGRSDVTSGRNDVSIARKEVARAKKEAASGRSGISSTYTRNELSMNKNRAAGMKSAVAGAGNGQSKTAEATKLCACGAPMIIRKNKQGDQFWGCTTFPNCRQTRSL